MSVNSQHSPPALVVRALALLILCATTAPVALSQQMQNRPYELRVEGSVFLPTGALNDQLNPAAAVGATASWNFRTDWSLLATGFWVPPVDRTSPVRNHMNVVQLDLGAEWIGIQGSIGSWTMSPFFGAGVGGRTYLAHGNGEPDQSTVAGYGSLGLSFASDRNTFRFGLRDYVSSWKGVQNDLSKVGNDVLVLVGFGRKF